MSVMRRPARYCLYVDESGDHVFHDKPTLQQASHRYLALIGCIFGKIEPYRTFSRALLEFKEKHLGLQDPDYPTILHRSDIKNRKGPFGRLCDASKRKAFDADLLRMVEAADFRVLLVVMDKWRHLEQYDNPFPPYNLGLTFLLQRYGFFLRHRNRTGNVVAERRGKREDRLLRRTYRDVYYNGDGFGKDAAFFQAALTSKELALEPKEKNCAGLQLADLLAYSLKQQYLEELGRAQPKTGFGKELAEVAAKKYDRDVYSGALENYGRVLFPK